MFLAAIFPTTISAQDAFQEVAETHVDHIEEFIERFNFKAVSPFYSYAKMAYPNDNVDRKKVLNALFDKRKSALLPDSVKKHFIADITDSERPVYLDIYDALWYASIPVEIKVDSVKMGMTITLEIQLNSDYSIEWSIVGINSPSLDNVQATDRFYISASSHATFFPELYTALASSTIFRSVVSDSQQESNTDKYLKLIAGKTVTNITIKKGIKYHFLQISGWIMTVEYAPQDYSFNTGWLISEVKSVDSFLDKRLYQNKILGINSIN